MNVKLEESNVSLLLFKVHTEELLKRIKNLPNKSALIIECSPVILSANIKGAMAASQARGDLKLEGCHVSHRQDRMFATLKNNPMFY